MTTIKNLFFFLGLTGLMFLTACNDDDVEPENEEEVITTVNYTLTPDGGGDTVTLTYRDEDGDGSGAPVITGGTLAANTTYSGSLELLNETESPAEDITEEIQEEDEDHLFFFTVNGANLTVAYADMDANGNPTGLATTVTTGDASAGTLIVTLRHEPTKPAATLAEAGGETDIEVSFPVSIQ